MSSTNFLDIEKLQQQTFQKFNQDGVSELIFGIFLYMLGLIYQNVAFIGVSASFVVFGPNVVLKLREKYIYPRLGYVKLKNVLITTRRKIVLAIVFSGTLLIEIFALYIIEHTLLDWPIWQKWLPILFSSLMLIYSLELIRQSGQKKYISIYILALGLGLFISLMHLGMSDPMDHFAVYTLLMGIFWLIFGFVRLRNFVKNNPVLKEEEGEVDAKKIEEEKIDPTY